MRLSFLVCRTDNNTRQTGLMSESVDNVLKCLAHYLTQDSIKGTYSHCYCCTILITVIIHPTHVTGEGDCETQRDHMWKKKKKVAQNKRTQGMVCYWSRNWGSQRWSNLSQDIKAGGRGQAGATTLQSGIGHMVVDGSMFMCSSSHQPVSSSADLLPPYSWPSSHSQWALSEH